MIYDDKLNFVEYWTYHPVITPERQKQHEEINEAAMKLARLVWDMLPIEDPQRNQFLNEIQFIRMMLNQQAVITEIFQLHDDIGVYAALDEITPASSLESGVE